MTEVVVVGAGPAGLAVATATRRYGVRCLVVERSEVGAAWRDRYDSLRLHTARRLSGLPGVPIPRRYGRWVARDDLVAYLRDYARRSAVPLELGVEVTRVDRDGAGGWRLTTSAGSRSAPAVVLATGFSRTAHLPDWPGRDTFTGVLLHSAEYREPSPYRGRHVLVVGAGNSAAEIAVELAAAGARVDMSVRTPPNIVRRDTLGVPSQVLGIGLRRVPERLMNPLSRTLRRVSVPNLARYGLPAPTGGFGQFLRTGTIPILDHGFVAAVRARRITVVPAVEGFEAGAVRLEGGAKLRPDAVIAATGFRPGLEPLVGHLDVLDASGRPRVHGARTLPHAPALYFVGLQVQLTGLIREVGREARSVGRALAAARSAALAGPG